MELNAAHTYFIHIQSPGDYDYFDVTTTINMNDFIYLFKGERERDNFPCDSRAEGHSAIGMQIARNVFVVIQFIKMRCGVGTLTRYDWYFHHRNFRSVRTFEVYIAGWHCCPHIVCIIFPRYYYLKERIPKIRKNHHHRFRSSRNISVPTNRPIIFRLALTYQTKTISTACKQASIRATEK